MSAGDRAEIARARLRAEQACFGAETLWGNGAPSQAMRLARDAFVTLMTIVRETSPGAPSDERACEQFGCSQQERRDLIAMRDALAQSKAPDLDADVSPEHARLFFDIVRMVRAVERRGRLYLMTDDDLVRVRARRAIRAALAISAIALFTFVAVRSRVRLRAEASALHDPKFEAARVLDGNKDSEWLLPDQTAGWLDVYVIPPRTVTRVQIVNAHMEPFRDRASRDVTIELYSNEQLVKSVDYTFAQYEARPDWVTIDVGVNEKVQRVRVVVKSWFFTGGGVAELRLR